MFVNIGYGNYVNSDQIISISRYDSAPVKRLAAKAKEENLSVDATQGRKTKSVICVIGNRVILSALMPETLAARCGSGEQTAEEEDREEMES